MRDPTVAMAGDLSDAAPVSPRYVVGEGRVRYGSKAVRGADAASFEPLVAPWARDRAAVYFEGAKVSRARPGSFRALGARVGCDSGRIFFAMHPSGTVTSIAIGKGQVDPERARVEEAGGRTYLVARRVWLVRHTLAALEMDAVTFEAMGRGYARDATRVVWSPSEGDPRLVADADAATFTTDEAGARDRHGPFLCGERDAGPLPVEREPDPRAAAERLVDGLWNESLSSWFADFDRSIVTDDGIVRVGTPPASPTPVPAHQLRLDGARLVLHASGRTETGTVSGMELLAGWLYGLARSKVEGDAVCVRVMLRTDGEIVSVDGAPPRWQRCLDLAYLFGKLGAPLEARLLLQRVLRWKPTTRGAKTPDDSAEVRAEKLLGAVLAQMPEETVPKGTTTQSATIWMVENGRHRSPDALVRRDIASSIGALAQHTRVGRERLAAVAEPLLVLLDDAEPAVRAEAAASFDFLCSVALDGRAYERALVYAEALSARHFNLDMQSARRWECLAALGRRAEAEQAWAACLRLTADDPLAVPTGSRSYAGFRAWRAARERGQSTS